MKRNIATILLWLTAAAIAVVLWNGQAKGQEMVPVPQELLQVWDWSPSGEHHSAVVRIDGSDGSHGSGCYVVLGNGATGVITAKHVVSRAGKATFPDGSTLQLPEGFVDKFGNDVAFSPVQHPTVKPLKIAPLPPPQGSRVEICGYGGDSSNNRLRHWWGRLKKTNLVSAQAYDSPVLQGDSGGPILDEKHRLISVVSAGDSEFGFVGVAKGFREMISPRPLQVIHFCTRLEAQCTPFGCPTPRRITPRSIPRPRGDLEPYAYPPNGPSTDDKPSPPIQKDIPNTPVVDYDKLSGIILDKMAKDDRFRGAKGERGPVGPVGPKGDDGMAPVIDYDRIAEDIQRKIQFSLSDDDIQKIAEKLPPFYPVWIDKDNNVVDSLKGGVRLGQTLPLRIEGRLKNADTRSN